MVPGRVKTTHHAGLYSGRQMGHHIGTGHQLGNEPQHHKCDRHRDQRFAGVLPAAF